MENETPKQIQIKPVITPEALKGVYSNRVQITQQPEEIIFDFFSVNFPMRSAMLGSRIFMSRKHAEQLHMVLGKVLTAKPVAKPEAAQQEHTGEIGFQTE